MQSLGGHLSIKAIEAKLTRDIEVFGKMDPYIVVEYIGTKYKSPVH